MKTSRLSHPALGKLEDFELCCQCFFLCSGQESLYGEQLWIGWLSCRQGCFQNKGTQSICKSSRTYESLIRLTQTAELWHISFEFSLPPGLVYKKYADIVLEVESMNDNNTQSWCISECILVLNASKYFPFSYTGNSCTSLIQYLHLSSTASSRSNTTLHCPTFPCC